MDLVNQTNPKNLNRSPFPLVNKINNYQQCTAMSKPVNKDKASKLVCITLQMQNYWFIYTNFS